MYEILLFYLIVILTFVFLRKRVKRYGIIFMIKFKENIKGIENKKILDFLTYFVIFLGFIFLAFSLYYVLSSFFELLIFKKTEKILTLALPGMNIPGYGKIPFLEGIISLFLLSIVHEFSHAFFLKSFKSKIKSIGIALLGPLLAGYVEPDEKEFERLKLKEKLSVLFSGSVSNILLGFLSFLLISSVLFPFYLNTIEIKPGIKILEVEKNSPAYFSGLKPNTIIYKVDNLSIKNISQFIEYIRSKKPGDRVIFSDNKTYEIIVGNKSGKPYYGIRFMQNFKIKNHVLYPILLRIINFLRLFGILNIGIGFANLLPIFFLDGGKALYYLLERKIGKERSLKILTFLTIFLIFVIIRIIIYGFRI